MNPIVHDIAIKLEKKLFKEFGMEHIRHSLLIFDADVIEARSFYDVVRLILWKCSNKDWSEFAEELCPYQGLNINDIPDIEGVYQQLLDLLSGNDSDDSDELIQ